MNSRLAGIGLALAALCTTLASHPATAEPGVYDDRIVFGQSAAFKGPAASLGLDLRYGILAAFDEANRKGGVHGRRVELVSYDDGYEPEKAIVNTHRLIKEDHVFALIGEVGTPTSKAVQPITQENSVPFIGPFTGASFLRDPKLTNVINVRASYDEETEEITDYLVKDLGLSRIAILYQDDTYGGAGLSGMTKALARRGLKPVADGTYMRNTTAVKRAALAIRKAHPEAVVIIGAYKPTAEFIRIARQIGIDARFLTVSFVGSKALASDLGKDGTGTVISQVVPDYEGTDNPLTTHFHEALQALAGDPEIDVEAGEPSFVSLEGYITGRLVIDVLQEIGPMPTRAKFLEVFSQPRSFDIDGVSLNYGPGDNQGFDHVFLTAIGPSNTFESIERGKSE